MTARVPNSTPTAWKLLLQLWSWIWGLQRLWPFCPTPVHHPPLRARRSRSSQNLGGACTGTWERVGGFEGLRRPVGHRLCTSRTCLHTAFPAISLQSQCGSLPMFVLPASPAGARAVLYSTAVHRRTHVLDVGRICWGVAWLFHAT